MKPAPRLILALLALTGWAAAEVPKNPPVTRYRKLWTDSPFTSKPPVEGPAEQKNRIDDYALLGVSPIASGYRVTIVEKKNPDERIIIESDRDNKDGFKVLSVVRKSGDPLGTTVRLATGALTGTVAFEEKLLEVKAPPAAAPQAQPAVPVPGQQPAANANAPQRQPRPRVVPPPAPGGNPQPNQQQQQRPQLRRR